MIIYHDLCRCCSWGTIEVTLCDRYVALSHNVRVISHSVPLLYLCNILLFPCEL